MSVSDTSGHETPDGQDSAHIAQPPVPSPPDPGWVEMESGPGAEPPNAGMLKYLHGFRRRWLLATTLGLFCGTLALAAVLLSGRETYTAAAVLRIASREQQLVFNTTDRQAANSFDVYKSTQVELLRSRFTLIAALRNPEVANLPIVCEQPDAVVWLARQISVHFPGNGEIMRLAITLEDAEAAAKLVNAVVDAYMNEVVDVERNQRRERLSEMDRLYTEKETEVRSKRTDLKALAEQLGTGDSQSLALKQQYALQLYTAYRTELIELQCELRRLHGELTIRRASLENIDEFKLPESDLDAAVKVDPLSVQLEAKRELLESNIDEVSTSFQGPVAESRIKALRKELDALAERQSLRREQLRTELTHKHRRSLEDEVAWLSSQIAVLNQQEQQFRVDAEQQRKVAEQFGGSSIDVEMMRAEIEHIERIVSGIADERERLKVELRSGGRVAELQEAHVPKVPDQRNQLSIALFAGLAGLLIPVGGITWWETRTQRINSCAEVTARLGMEIIGALPLLPDWAMRPAKRPSVRHRLWRVRLQESVKSVTASMLRKAEIDRTQVVLVSSAVGGEGKTTLASQVAMSLAFSGRRTLLVDFDLRRPALHRVFDVPNDPGVAELLRAECGLGEAISRTEAGNLSILAAGRPTRESEAFVANGQVGRLFEEFRRDYEFVVVDGGPILPLADTRLIAPHADAVVLSIVRDVSRVPNVMAACEILRQFGARSLAAVVTGLSTDSHYYGAYGSYGYDADRPDFDRQPGGQKSRSGGNGQVNPIDTTASPSET